MRQNKKIREHLPGNFDPENGQHVSNVVDFLQSHPPYDFSSAKRWFSLFSELSDAANELQTRLDLEIALDGGNSDASTRIGQFEKNVLTHLMNSRAQLMDIYLQSPWRRAMHADDHDKIAREVTARRKFASPLLSPLQIEENALVREFKSFNTNATCQFFGRSTPLGVVIGKLNDPRPEIRREAFFSHWRRINESRDWLEELFTKLLNNRLLQAQRAGANSFTELCFADLGRFDYGPEECKVFRESVHAAIVPMLSNLQSKQLLSLGTKTLKPWDINIWPRFVPSERPCQGDLTDLLDAGGHILTQIHPGFGSFYHSLRADHCIDIEPRTLKSPGAFCVVLPESKTPFIFGNFAGHFRDAFTLLHEFGHALHGSASLQIENPLMRHPGLEFCEVSSMGLEFLAQPFLEEFWPRANDARKAWALHCFNALQFWPFMALIDEWQHTIYDQKMTDASDRNALWRELSRKYRPSIDWSDAEEFEELGWLSRPHPITSPFYFIDYGIAQLGAVELRLKSRKNYRQTVDDYIQGLSLGAQRNLPGLFAAAGLHFDFSKPWVETLGHVLCEEIEKTDV